MLSFLPQDSQAFSGIGMHQLTASAPGGVLGAYVVENALAVVEVAVIGAVTPGPNNAAVMQAAVSGGVRRALASIQGVIAGSLLLAALTLAGLGTLFELEPMLVSVFTILSAAYLIWLGLRMIRAAYNSGYPDQSARHHDLPSGLVGMALFQLVNPKAWGLMAALVSVMHPERNLMESALFLAAVSIFVPALCLGLWAAMGLVISRHLQQPKVRFGFDFTMGALLILAAVALLAKTRS